MKKHLFIGAAALLAACSSESAHVSEPAEARFPATISLSVELDGTQHSIEVERNDTLFAPHYAEYILIDGALEKTDPSEWASARPCYYTGRSGGLVVSVKTCDGIEGTAIANGSSYTLSSVAGEVHATRDPHVPTACGVDAVPSRSSDSEVRDETRQQALGLVPSFAEILVMRDVELQRLISQGYRGPDPALAANTVAILYDGTPLTRRVLPLLVGSVDIMGSDPWGVPTFYGNEIDPGSYLDNFNAWLHANPGSVPAYDEATLLSGWDPTGSTVGLATVGGACNTKLAGALVYGLGSTASVAQTMAHELGHTIGMWHDGPSGSNTCPQDGYVMTAIYAEEGPYPTTFSSCSLIDGNAFLESEAGACINSLSAPAFPSPRCGDGKVEAGEQCDCGPDGCTDRDPCCNQTTCQFNAGATCSAMNPCCDALTCQPTTAEENIVCRPSADAACDIPEFCDGSPHCPVDKVQPTGDACNDGTWDGACYVGRCITRGGICEVLADSYYFDDTPYDPDCDLDGECDVMECVSEGACVYTQEPSHDGSICVEGSQCYGGRCVPSSTLPGADGCNDPARDSDEDGTRDCDDACPYDPLKTAAGDCGCGSAEGCAPNSANPANSANSANNVDGSNNTNSNNDGPNDAPDEPTIEVVKETGEGCTQARGDASWLALLGVVAFRRRR